jgi:uncharacterized membrane protein YccC
VDPGSASGALAGLLRMTEDLSERREKPAGGQAADQGVRPTKPTPWIAFWQTVIRFQAEKMLPWPALRNALGMAIPLAVGVVAGSVSSGVVACTGALNVAFSDSSDSYAQRGRRMLIASALVCFAVFTGSLCAANPALVVAVSGAWAFSAGIMVALGATPSDMGVISLVTLVVFSAQSMTPERAALSGLLALAGGLLQTLLALTLWPVRRREPERRVLGDLYLELSRAAGMRISSSEAPPASAQITQAQVTFSAPAGHSVELERYRLLLSQAERIRLSLLTLARLRARIHRERESGPEVEILDRCFAISSALLDSIGHSLLADRRAEEAPGHLQELKALAEQLRECCDKGSSPVTAMVVDARSQMDALAGQLRSVVDLSAYALPEGIKAFKQREARQPWSLRLSGTVATLRANLNLKSAACRHAIRLAACVALGSGLAYSFGARRPYWVPMTIAIVLKPDFTATFSRGVLRLIGTFIGLLLATGLFHLLSPGSGIQVALIAVLAFVLRCFGPANYGILVTAVTAMVVFMFSVIGVPPAEVMAARALNTVVGGAIALVAYWVWPTWEQTQVSESIAQMLDAYRNYFRTLRESYLRTEVSYSSELDRTRAAGRLARSNLEASIDRLSVEPGVSSERMRLLSGMLASSHRLAHALMALESGLSLSHPVPARKAFLTLANHIELTLYSLSAALRGSPLTREDLPDLREDHHALVGSGDSLTERYALVNVETDRITNSLNTLSEEVLRWIVR